MDTRHQAGFARPLSMLRVVCCLLVGFAVIPALATERVALVIGNASYQSAPLSNPVNDAQAMKAKLESLGFRTVYGTNLDRAGLYRKVQEFRQTLRQDGVALVFYSGHAVEVNGVNYLLPVDNAQITSVEDVEIHGLAAQNLVSQMEAVEGRLNVVVLDACRNNPLPSRAKSASRGLGQMKAQRGTLIAYATAANATADDGRGRHSPYTQALLRWLGEPGLDVQQVFNRVGLEVSDTTNGTQTPWVSSSPVPPILLAGGSVVIQRPQQGAAEPDKGTLQITVTPLAAQVYVNGYLVGKGNQSLKWAGGEGVTVTAKAPGHEEFSERVLVRAGQVAGVRLSLTALPQTTSAPVAASPSVTVTSPSPSSSSSAIETEMVRIPAGSFLMGSAQGEEGAESHEYPQHRVQLQAFAIGKTEVTFDEYDRFARATGRALPRDTGCGRGRRPVINVTWDDATAYAQWLSGQTGKRYRLPTEAEWEYTARAGTSGPFSFDGPISPQKANYNSWVSFGGSSKDRAGYRECTVEAGSLPANPWGLHEVHGNVLEWTQDCWNINYVGAPSDGRARTSGNCALRVLRGGAFGDWPQWLRAAHRNLSPTPRRTYDIGFRLAQD